MIVPLKDHPEFKALASEVRQLSPDRKTDLDATLGGRFDSERTMTVADIAEVLDVHEVTVRRWIRNGELKATRIRGYRVNPIDLADFLRNRGTGFQPQENRP